MNGGTSCEMREHPPTNAYLPIFTNGCAALKPLMMAFSPTVTWPASCTPFTRITPSPTWQSCARCTYDMMKQFCPIVVLYDCVVPRLIVAYSRMIVPSPTSTIVCSPLNLRSCGSPPRMEPDPTLTFVPRMTLHSNNEAGGERATDAPSHTTPPVR